MQNQKNQKRQFPPNIIKGVFKSPKNPKGDDFMFLTERRKSNEHTYLETLSKRAILTEEEEKRLSWLQRGFEGEQLYDQIFDEVGHKDLNIFRDIWIQADKSLTQIDALIVTDETVFINEIKNYSGNYKYENNIWQIGKIQISDDPIIQSKRAASKLIKIFRENKINVKTDFNIIFPNPYFILSTDDSYCRSKTVKREMMKQYFRSQQQLSSWSNADRIVQIIQDHIVLEPQYKASIDQSRLTLGRQCLKCSSFELNLNRYSTTCKICSDKATNKDHVQAAIRDHNILFTLSNIKSRDIRTFINNEVSKSTVKRYINDLCLLNNKGKHATYRIDPAHATLKSI